MLPPPPPRKRPAFLPATPKAIDECGEIVTRTWENGKIGDIAKDSAGQPLGQIDEAPIAVRS